VEEVPAAGSGSPAITVTGNRCPRGAAYAQEEIRAPKRVVTATCTIAFPPEETTGVTLEPKAGTTLHRSLTAPRRIPVKTSTPCPKEKINELLEDIYRLKVSLPVKAGEKLIADWKNLGVDVVAARSME